MPLLNLETARNQYLNAVGTYIQDTSEQNLNNAISAGKVYTDEIKIAKASNPELNETTFFTNPEMHGLTNRNKVRVAWGLLAIINYDLKTTVPDVPTLADINDIYVDGDRVYVAQQGAVRYLDMTDFSVHTVSSFGSNQVWCIDGDDDYLYVGFNGVSSQGFRRILKSTFVGSSPIHIAGNIYSIKIDGDHLHLGGSIGIGGSWRRHWIIDIQTWTVVHHNNDGGNHWAFASDEQYIYTGYQNDNRFSIINKSDWSVVPGTPPLPGITRGIATDDQYVYIAHADGRRFTVVDKSDWSVVSGTPSLPSHGFGVTTDDQYVYIAHWNGNFFTVVDKSDWSVVTETPTLPGNGQAIAFKDEHIFVGGVGGLTIVNRLLK